MFPKRSGIVLLLMVLAGCGGGDSGGDTDKPKPEAKVNHKPRVEGRWRVVYTPLQGQEQRATWTVTPDCDIGACGFTIKSTGGAAHHFLYDRAIKDWTGNDRQTSTCADQDTGEVSAKRGYRIRSQINLTPIRVVRTRRATYVTEMFGDRRERFDVTAEGEAAGCFSQTSQDGVRAVRIDSPSGKPERVGGVGYGE
jgi:hypothetical protein